MRIRVIDLETTGLAPPAGVCEVAYCDLVSQGQDAAGNPSNWTFSTTGAGFIDPQVDIPPDASAVHHIIAADVRGAPAFAEIIPWLLDASGEQLVLCAHNCKFERAWLTDEVTGRLPWICTYKCSLHVWPEAPNHQNQTLRYWLNPEGLERERAAPAHRAFPDAYVTVFLLRELLRHTSPNALVDWSSSPALLPVCRFGKHSGKRWSEVDSDYLHWILTKDFDEDVVFTAQYHLRERVKATTRS